jgi:DNA-binding transcriptional ArsR family regulator
MTSHPLPPAEFGGPDDEFLIDDLETIELLNHPVRSTLLQLLLFHPRSVKELASELDVPVTRLYYHVNMLEDAGVIRVVETRKVGAMIQKLYQASARSYRPSPTFVQGIEDPRKAARVGVATVLDTARVDMEQVLTARFSDPAASHPPSALGRTMLRLSTADAEEFRDQLTKLVETFEARSSEDGLWIGFTYVMAPSAGLTGSDMGDA